MRGLIYYAAELAVLRPDDPVPGFTAPLLYALAVPAVQPDADPRAEPIREAVDRRRGVVHPVALEEDGRYL